MSFFPFFPMMIGKKAVHAAQKRFSTFGFIQNLLIFHLLESIPKLLAASCFLGISASCISHDSMGFSMLYPQLFHTVIHKNVDNC